MEGARQVDGHHLVPCRVGHADDETVVGDAGVVDEDLDRSELGLDRVERGGDRSRILDGDGHGGGSDGCGQLGYQFPGGLGVRAVADRDPVPVAGERAGGCRADAPGGAGHERDPAGHRSASRSSGVATAMRARSGTVRLARPVSMPPGPTSTIVCAPRSASVSCDWRHCTGVET